MLDLCFIRKELTGKSLFTNPVISIPPLYCSTPHAPSFGLCILYVGCLDPCVWVFSSKYALHFTLSHLLNILSCPTMIWSTALRLIWLVFSRPAKMAFNQSSIIYSQNSFGPTLPNEFDFTLLFENTILSILPSVLLLVALPFRAAALYRRPRKVARSVLYENKLVSQSIIFSAVPEDTNALTDILIILYVHADRASYSFCYQFGAKNQGVSRCSCAERTWC